MTLVEQRILPTESEGIRKDISRTLFQGAPFELINYTAFNNEWHAILFEKYLKLGSGRAFAKRHYY